MDYRKIEWYCGIKSFIHRYFSVLKKMVEYSLVKVISKHLLKNFSICFLRLILHIQILMYRNLDFLVKSATVVGVLLVSASMLFFLSEKIVAVLDEKNNNTKASCSCDRVVCTATKCSSSFFEKRSYD